MSETRDRRDTPGYRENLRDADHMRTRDQIADNLRFWRRSANRTEYAQHLAELSNPEAPIDWEALSHAPLFEIDSSFQTHPPVEFEPGTEPAFAPISREQLRLLLVKALPEEIKPFVEDNFIFKYDVAPNPDGKKIKKTPGPKLDKTSVPGKVVVTFYRDNFLSKGSPPGKAPDSDDARRAPYVWSFVDPAKVSFLIGKMIGSMTLPTDDEKQATEFDPEFHRFKASKPTDAILGPLLGGVGDSEDPENRPFTEQWADFVGLCVTLPDEARKLSPAAYELYKKKLKNFLDPTKDAEARDRLPDTIDDCQVTYMDLRTPHEKAVENPPSPQRNFLDRVYGTANRALAPFNLRLIYEVPEDEERAAALADDDKEVSKLIENYDTETRDKKFGEILAEQKGKYGYDPVARNIARRYLIAASKEGEFEEWRIYAWLKVFSKTFNEPGNGREIGSVISEDDYKDLRLIYRISEKEGNRLGSSVIPYEPQTHRDPFQSHDEFVYLRRKEADFVAAVRKKVDAKSARGVYDSNPKSFDQLVKNGRKVGLDTEFGPATLLPILKDTQLANEMSEVLKIMGVKVVSTDARAVAEAYWGHYLANGRRPTDHMSQEAVEVIEMYGEELTRPATNEVDEFLRVSPESVAQRDVVEINKEMEKSDLLRTRLEQSIVGDLSNTDVNVDVQDELTKLMHDQGITDYEKLKDKIGAFIDAQTAKSNGARNALYEKRELRSLFLRHRKTLEDLARVIDWQRRAEPAYVPDIKLIVDELKTNGQLVDLIVKKDITQEEYEKQYKDKGIALTGEQEKELEAIMTNQGNLMTDEGRAKIANKERGAMIKKNIMTSPPEARLPLLARLMESGHNDLRATIQTATKVGGGYRSGFETWKKSHPIYESPYIKSAFTDRVGRAMESLEIARPESRARIRRHLDLIVEEIPKSWQYIDKNTKKKPAAGAGP